MPYCTSCGNDVTGRKFCTNCGQQVGQRQTAAPKTETAKLGWWSEKHSTSWWTTQIVGLGVLLLVAATASYLFTTKPWLDTARGTGTPSGGADTTSAGPPPRAGRTCWNHSTVAAGQSCPVPSGIDGLRAASPTFVGASDDGSCGGEDALDHTSDTVACTINLPGHPAAEVWFGWYASQADEETTLDNYGPCEPADGNIVSICSGGGYSGQDVIVRYDDSRMLFTAEVGSEDGGADSAATLRWVTLNDILTAAPPSTASRAAQ